MHHATRCPPATTPMTSCHCPPPLFPTTMLYYATSLDHKHLICRAITAGGCVERCANCSPSRQALRDSLSGVSRNSGAPGQISKSSPPSPFPICIRHPLSLPYPTSPSFWPRVGPGHPSSPLSIYFSSFPLLSFSFFHWLYLFSSFVHPFPFYQNSPTPFLGRRS